MQWRVHSYGLYQRLERRFDGEIPDHLRRIAIAGSQTALEIALARANGRCCDALAFSAARAAALRRSTADDLAIWRREGLAWRQALGQLGPIYDDTAGF